ncbi:MarR family winged helix-turn-helix transcriptional regulator [Variovorax sp. RT4R15]|uniref:MarR family winged helix-turn-helix transcriptional regulator n=1 Tax=Variovorax sp. RT4R15 TaxID=3443737 RepID=UPI003F46B648
MSKMSEAMLLDQQLCFSVYSTSLAMTQAYKPLLEDIGLTYPQYLVMLVLWERDGLTVKSLAERLSQDSGSVTPVVKRLEAEGLLLRKRDKQDERNLDLTLTPKGRALREKGVKVNQSFAKVCGLSTDDLATLRTGLTQLRSRLQA